MSLLNLLLADKLKKDNLLAQTTDAQSILLDRLQGSPIPQGGITPEEFQSNPAYGQDPRLQEALTRNKLLGTGLSTADLSGVLGKRAEQVKPTTLQQNFLAFKANNPSTEETLNTFRRQEGVTVNNIMGDATKAGFMSNETKKQQGLPVDRAIWIDAKGKPSILSPEFTPAQQKAAGNALTMIKSSEDLVKLTEAEAGAIPDTSYIDLLDEMGIPKLFTNWSRSDANRQYEAAKSNWAEINLRDKSGAALPETEVAAELKRFFPVLADDLETRKLKARRRAEREKSMLARSGLAGSRLLENEAQPPAPTAPKINLLEKNESREDRLRRLTGN